jgi:hypothetical protein
MANVLLMDGFDAYDFNKKNTAAPSIHSKWILNLNVNQFAYPGRYGGQALGFNDQFNNPYAKIFIPGNPYIQSCTTAFALIFQDITRAENSGKLFQIIRDQESQMALSISNIGALRVWRGDTMVAESAPNLARTMDWHYLEVEYVCHTATGRIAVYLDGTKVLEFKGNTQNQSAYGFNGVMFSSSGNNTLAIDDFYMIDQPVRIGERRIETLRPNGDVAGNQFTASSGANNFAMLNETLVDETSYVTADAVGSKDLYNFTNLSTTPYRIDAVQLNVWATKTDSDTRQMQTIFKSGNTETTSPSYNLPTNHINMNRIEQVDPATGAAWTPNGVNALQAGFKVSL